MALRGSYGEVLRDARERKGMDVGTASRRLRIRPDILRAIEEADFARMPPRGYTRNMVNAYARMVGLNASEITSRYLDEMHAYETGRQRAGSSSRDFGEGRRRAGSDSRPSREGSSRSRSQRDRGASRSSGRVSGMPVRPTGPAKRNDSRGSSRPNPNTFPSLYSNNAAPRRPSIPQLPVLIGAIAVILVVVIVLVLVFGGNKQPVQETPTVYISGMTETPAPEGSDAAVSAQPVAPTSIELVYEVASGGSSWIETYENGSDTPNFAGVVEGPSSTKVNVTGTFTIRTANVTPVTVTVDGEKVELTADGSGYSSYTADFAAYLEQWNEEHGVSSSSSSSASSASNVTSSSGGSSASSSSSSGSLS